MKQNMYKASAEQLKKTNYMSLYILTQVRYREKIMEMGLALKNLLNETWKRLLNCYEKTKEASTNFSTLLSTLLFQNIEDITATNF